MLVMKSGKRHLTDGMELPNQDKIRTLAENETYKYKKNISEEVKNYLRQNSPVETLSKE